MFTCGVADIQRVAVCGIRTGVYNASPVQSVFEVLLQIRLHHQHIRSRINNKVCVNA